jgi:predicted enzyme involved in methoxymalonyl-ACP biosynthesis
MKVQDKFGDYGLTGAVILAHEDGAARIDTFLMSCRILGRRLEDALLAEAIATAQALWNVERVSAEFRPTAKNAQVADFFDKRGFTPMSSTEMEKRYLLDLSATPSLHHDKFITVERRS